MKKYKIAVQLYGIRHEIDKDMDGAFAAVADIGYKYVEIASFFGKMSDEINELLTKHGLCAIGAHVGIGDFLQDNGAVMDYIARLGIKNCTIPYYSADKLPATDVWEKETKMLFSSYASECIKRGITPAYHNHSHEFAVQDGKTVHERIFNELGELINPQIDTCWVDYAGVDPCAVIRKYADRMKTVHFKDYICKSKANGASAGENGFEFRPLGCGVMDFKKILPVLDATAVKCIIVEQDSSHDRPPLEAAKVSLRYLETLCPPPEASRCAYSNNFTTKTAVFGYENPKNGDFHIHYA